MFWGLDQHGPFATHQFFNGLLCFSCQDYDVVVSSIRLCRAMPSFVFATLSLILFVSVQGHAQHCQATLCFCLYLFR